MQKSSNDTNSRQSLAETANIIYESKERDRRLGVLAKNAELIVKLKAAAYDGTVAIMRSNSASAPSQAELLRDINAAERTNKELGSDVWLSKKGNAWTNQEGLYVGRQLDRLARVISNYATLDMFARFGIKY